MKRHSKLAGLILLCILSPWVAANPLRIPSTGSTGTIRPSIKSLTPTDEQLEKKSRVNAEDETEQQAPTTSQARIRIDRLVINNIIEHPEINLTASYINKVAHQLLTKAQSDNPKGLTFTQIQHLAKQISLIYRKRGYLFTRAYIPKQDLKEHILHLTILDARLSKVTVTQSKLYDKDFLARELRTHIGKHLHIHEIEKELLHINALPGLSVHSLFRPGSKQGETDILLEPYDEKRVEGNVALDNYGNPLIGRYHALGIVQVNNPFAAGDLFSVSAANKLQPNNGTYAALHYDYPLHFGNDHIGWDYSVDRFSLSGELKDLNVTNKTKMGQLYWRHHITQSRHFNWRTEVEINRITAITKVLEVNAFKDSLTVLGIGTALFKHDLLRKMTVHLGLHLYHGFNDILGSMGDEIHNANHLPPSRVGANDERAEAQFNRWNLDLHLKKYFNNHQALGFNLVAQYSPDLLVSIQQFNLGGVNSVRAYAAAEYLVDKGLYSSVEWSLPAPATLANQTAFSKYTWGQILNIFTFVDVGFGSLNSPNDFQIQNKHAHVSLYGYGAGISLHPGDKFTLRVQAAKPFGFSRPADDGRAIRYWLNLSYNF